MHVFSDNIFSYVDAYSLKHWPRRYIQYSIFTEYTIDKKYKYSMCFSIRNKALMNFVCKIHSVYSKKNSITQYRNRTLHPEITKRFGDISVIS